MRKQELLKIALISFTKIKEWAGTTRRQSYCRFNQHRTPFRLSNLKFRDFGFEVSVRPTSDYVDALVQQLFLRIRATSPECRAVIDRPYSLWCPAVGALYERPSLTFVQSPSPEFRTIEFAFEVFKPIDHDVDLGGRQNRARLDHQKALIIR
jgi:hypothetical protein